MSSQHQCHLLPPHPHPSTTQRPLQLRKAKQSSETVGETMAEQIREDLEAQHKARMAKATAATKKWRDKCEVRLLSMYSGTLSLCECVTVV